MILGCQYVCALNPDIGTGELSARTQRHFTTLGVDFPSPTSLVTIFQTFLDGTFVLIPPGVHLLNNNIAMFNDDNYACHLTCCVCGTVMNAVKLIFSLRALLKLIVNKQ